PCSSHTPVPPLLPSVPTRRSSDLHPQHERSGGEQLRAESAAKALLDLRAVLVALQAAGDDGPDDERRDRERAEHQQGDGEVVAEDRKSTRLNSSHVSISYAVFCLK